MFIGRDAVITALLVGKNETATIEVDVVASAPQYIVEGKDSILLGRTETYTGKKIENGVEVSSTWSFVIDNTGVSNPASSSDYNFKVASGNTCNIENSNNGKYVRLVGTCEGVEVEKVIQLKYFY